MTIDQKLDAIIIPEIAFKNKALPFALDYLGIEVYRLDAEETIPARRGIHLGWFMPDVEAMRVRVTMSFHDCDLRTGLEAIAARTGLALLINAGGAYFWRPAETLAASAPAPTPEPVIPGLPITADYDERVKARHESLARALALCPAIDNPNTLEGRAFKRLADHYLQTNDPILHNDDLPYLIAVAVVDIVGDIKSISP